ncbi:hypothetical protein [Absidia glauca]|uniref:Rho-GAP domain-containing protein n=1 Tax=Absidia glauca TaxID=4829 RepID=A0A168MLU2_ABSGL|nr:hypothetical protein [Absidia glauca]
MFYSFAFSAHVARLCMADIVSRGNNASEALGRERLIPIQPEPCRTLRKEDSSKIRYGFTSLKLRMGYLNFSTSKFFKRFSSSYFLEKVPNNVLFFKVFYHQVVDADDLERFDVHSVATLLQDALWGCPERILSKKTWRLINYETCTLDDLCTVIPAQQHQLLTDIVRFLVTVMKHKRTNLMDAYQLGDAMGKVTLAPADCNSILVEKAGHFLMRMVIEESKQQQRQRTVPRQQRQLSPSSTLQHKMEATQAKAKSYNRQLKKQTRQRQPDWFTTSDLGLQSLQDGYPPAPPAKSSHSIFDTTLAQDTPTDLSYTSPLLFRILVNANTVPPLPSSTTTLLHDDTTDLSYFSLDCDKNNLCHAFDDVCDTLNLPPLDDDDATPTETSSFSTFSKLNRSLFALKIKPPSTKGAWSINNASGFSQDSSAHSDATIKRTMTLTGLQHMRKRITGRPKIIPSS